MYKPLIILAALIITSHPLYAGTAPKWVTAREKNCKALYEVVYSDGDITLPDNCDNSPALAGGHPTHTYYGVIKDPGISASEFSKASKAACKSREPLDYAEFKSVVCKKQKQ